MLEKKKLVSVKTRLERSFWWPWLATTVQPRQGSFAWVDASIEVLENDVEQLFVSPRKNMKFFSLIGKQGFEVQRISSKSYWCFILFSHTFWQIQSAMPCRQVDDFSQKIASDFAAACRTDEESEDCFGTAYNYGRDHVTRLTHEIIRLQRESGLSRKEIVESIKDLASHMNALSYVFLVAADVAEKALDHD